jgi:hypothetical protein
MRPESAGSRWETLQATAPLPEVQAVIRRDIARGRIRIVPAAGSGIRIIPATDDRPFQALEPSPPPCPGSIRPSTVCTSSPSKGARDEIE